MRKSGLGISNTNLEKIATRKIINIPQSKTKNLSTTTEIKKEALPKVLNLATTTEIKKVAPTEIKKESETKVQPKIETPVQTKPEVPAQTEPEVQATTPTPAPAPAPTTNQTLAPAPITTIITNPDPFPGASTTHDPRANFALTNSDSCAYNENFKCYSDSLCSYYKDKDVRGWCFFWHIIILVIKKKCS